MYTPGGPHFSSGHEKSLRGFRRVEINLREKQFVEGAELDTDDNPSAKDLPKREGQ
jgi:hypothetical protein